MWAMGIQSVIILSCFFFYDLQKQRACGICSDIHQNQKDVQSCPRMMCGNCLETGHPAKFCRKAKYLHEKVRCKRCRHKGHHAKVCMLNLSCYKYHYMYMSVKYQQYLQYHVVQHVSICMYKGSIFYTSSFMVQIFALLFPSHSDY